MATLRPFRQVNEHDIIGLFAYSTADLSSTTVASKGAVVKIESGWKATADLAISSDIGASFNNVTSPRFNVPATVTLCGQTDTPIGIILQDVKNLDENGEPLKFNPRKAEEGGACYNWDEYNSGVMSKKYHLGMAFWEPTETKIKRNKQIRGVS